MPDVNNDTSKMYKFLLNKSFYYFGTVFITISILVTIFRRELIFWIDLLFNDRTKQAITIFYKGIQNTIRRFSTFTSLIRNESLHSCLQCHYEFRIRKSSIIIIWKYRYLMKFESQVD